MELEFSQEILGEKKGKISNLIQISLVGAELLLAGRWRDGRTDMYKVMVAFRNFANAPKNT